MSARVLWVCPNGCPAVLGPRRPRRDNTCRYCLICSGASGRLVARAAPTIERLRESKVLARKARQAHRKLAATLQFAAVHMVAGVDTWALLRDLLALKCMSACRGKGGRLRRAPELHIRRCARKPNRRGLAQCVQHRIILAEYPGITANEVRDTLAHELAHIAVGPHQGHGTLWRTTYRLICEEAYGVRPRVENRYLGEVARQLDERAAAGEAKP